MSNRQLEEPNPPIRTYLPSLGEASSDPGAHSNKWRKYLAYAGPGILVSVGYMDPGNWGTDIGAGAKFNYSLLWVVLLSSLMAIFLQNLCARLGLVSRLDLAQACHHRYERRASFVLWIFAQIAIIACDLAEVIGSAVALNLLLGIPLIVGVFITALDVMLLIGLLHFGFRKLEAVVAVLVLTISGCFIAEISYSHPAWGEVVAGTFIPNLSGLGAAALAVGILGATVMPHNLYLHSAAVQTRKISNLKEALDLNKWDTIICLSAAFFVNAAILIVSAATFHAHGKFDVSDLGEAQSILRPLLGGIAATVFAVGLLASGQSSTITGTLAGQVVMKGLLNLEWKPWVQRVVTRSLAIIPAAVMIAIYGKNGTLGLLIGSQIVLSMQLPFAVFPLLGITADPRYMGEYANSIWTKRIGFLVAWAIVLLNAYLIWDSMGIIWFLLAVFFGTWFAIFLHKNTKSIPDKITFKSDTDPLIPETEL